MYEFFLFLGGAAAGWVAIGVRDLIREQRKMNERQRELFPNK